MKRFSVRTLAAGGVLIALNVVLSRLVSIPIGNAFRISLGSVPIILSGLWLGPLAGGICGAAGDLMGCLVAGYAPNPFITASTVLMGVIPGLSDPRDEPAGALSADDPGPRADHAGHLAGPDDTGAFGHVRDGILADLFYAPAPERTAAPRERICGIHAAKKGAGFRSSGTAAPLCSLKEPGVPSPAKAKKEELWVTCRTLKLHRR